MGIPIQFERTRPSLWDFPKAALIIVLLQALTGLVVGIFYGTTRTRDGAARLSMLDFLPYSSAVFSLSLLYTAWHFGCRKYRTSFKEGLALKKPTKRAVWVAITLALVMALVMVVVSFGLYSHDSSALEEAPIGKLMSSSQGMLLFAIIAFLGSPFEEIFFRGFLFGHLQTRLGSLAAIVLTSLLFAVVHAFQLGGDLPSIALILVVGTALTLQRYYTRSTIPGIITHGIYNSILAGLIVVSMVFGPQHAEAKAAVVHTRKPDVETLKVDLQGHRIGRGMKSWSFDSVEEFQGFELLSEHESTDKLTYQATIKLKGVIGPGAKADIEITYDRPAGGYRFREVTDKGTLTLDH